ncbi:MAG: GNAT family N-acetyltransferase [Oceanospirillaceae bacterium]|nr:GNAT family N-acetyltransferase [Oceanospirillaceae bacterium]
MRVDRVDYTNPDDQLALVNLLNAYAQDPLGGGAGLTPEVQKRLPEALSRMPGACSFIVRRDGAPLGLLNAFTGFSTFNARPLINIHDVFVVPEARGSGVLQMLFDAIEAEARAQNCCKITLEVLEENHRAQAAYRRQGFRGYDVGEVGGEALFWQKKLD